MIYIRDTPTSIKLSNNRAGLIWLFLTDVVYLKPWLQEAISELKKPNGEYDLNDSCAERHGKVIKLYHMLIDYPELFIPYEKFMDLLNQWKHTLDQKYEELVIMADEDYNFTILMDNRMVGGKSLKTF